MSKVSDLIFHNAKHYITSEFGPRATISTAAGNTSTFHNGTDYGTNGKKLTQYAIEDGEVLSCGTADDGAKYVWVSYPRLGVKMLHWHLDTIKVKKGQKVTADTALGTTGKTGKATGVHLHLGIKKLSGGDYIDPEKWSKNEYKAPSASGSSSSAASSASGYKPGTYVVTASVLNVRSGPGKNYTRKRYTQMTANAREQIKKKAGYSANGYVKGMVCTVYEVKGSWGRTPSGWICLDYCEKK
jgi:murein DD-endopeptidase MepM/ murein hydrolase activator NlpD